MPRCNHFLKHKWEKKRADLAANPCVMDNFPLPFIHEPFLGKIAWPGDIASSGADLQPWREVILIFAAASPSELPSFV